MARDLECEMVEAAEAVDGDALSGGEAGLAEAAGVHAEEDFAGRGVGERGVVEGDGAAGFAEDDGGGFGHSEESIALGTHYTAPVSAAPAKLIRPGSPLSAKIPLGEF